MVLSVVVLFLTCAPGRGATIRILGGGGVFLEVYIFVWKMGEINKWPQGMVEINSLSTKEVEININRPIV